MTKGTFIKCVEANKNAQTSVAEALRKAVEKSK